MKKILFITLSNIGDVVLTLPVLDYLKGTFPEAEITVMTGPRAQEIFIKNPRIKKVILYDKRATLGEQIDLFFLLKRGHFDAVIDLRNTLYGALLPARHKLSLFPRIPADIRNMQERHLCKIKAIVSGFKCQDGSTARNSLCAAEDDEAYVDALLKKNGVTGKDKIIVISPGARSHTKRWAKDKFVELIRHIGLTFGAKIFLVGDREDASITGYITGHSEYPVVDLGGMTTLAQLACLLKRAKCLVTNDSAVLHIGSYLNIPVAAIFGPTDEAKYGPWSQIQAVVKKDIFCRPCRKAQCRFGTLECLQLVKVEDVLRQVKALMDSSFKSQASKVMHDYKRILIVRTDRIGDVLLSTPVIRAMREANPSAYIAMMVSPYAKEIVEDNPYLDQVIIYDKDYLHKSWQRSVKFALNLKKKRFDLAVILHPTNRVHLVAFFAGIPRRIGYDRKLGALLTDRIKHEKQFGEKHELEYNLDLLRHLGIELKEAKMFMPIKPESEKWVAELLAWEHVTPQDQLLAVHPGASCPSKIWPVERFAEVAERLREKYGFKILIVAGPKDIAIAKMVAARLHSPVINLGGKTSVSQLASVLKRCRLFISNDSGPVHIAAALGTPVISIFGRNQKGLSPRRWGPWGKKSAVLHKEVGCIKCLAHNCTKEFLCLKAISVADVLKTADSLLNLS